MKASTSIHPKPVSKAEEQHRIDQMIQSAYECRNSKPKESLAMAEEAYALAKKIGYKKGIAASASNIGFAFLHQSKNDEAQAYLLEALGLCEELGDEAGLSAVQYNIGVFNLRAGIYDQAISYLRNSLTIREKLDDREGMASCYFQLTYLCVQFNDVEGAMEYASKSLAIRKEMNNPAALGASLMIMGDVYMMLKDFDKAREYIRQSLELRKASGERLGYFVSLVRWIDLHLETKQYDVAESFVEEGLRNAKEMSIPFGMIRFKQSAGKLEFLRGNLLKAKEVYLEALELAEKNAFKSLQYEILEALVDIQKSDGSYKEALESYVKFHKLKEEVVSQQNNVQLKSIKFINQIEIVKREAEIEKLKNIELKAAYSIIEEKNRDIRDSINYATRIQHSFLATKDLLDKNLHDYFVFFRPKDVVSGDFYWGAELANHQFILATADSTGHGVPGAIMSLLNITSLEKAIEDHTDPADILNHARQTIIERLKKDGSAEGGKDGMDCSLICFDPGKKKLFIANANNPVWIVRGEHTHEVKPDKMPVGKSDRDKEPFSLKTFDLHPGDVIYTLTDGFPDQFGGEKGKKYMSRTLKSFLAAKAMLPMDQQRELLEKEFLSWKGDLEQVDDVTIIGIRV